jgi:hypothetical protein
MGVSTATYTGTGTYTVVDVRRVFDQFAADYDMAAQSTGLVSDDHVTSVVHDVKAFAENAYLDRVDIVLRDATGQTTRAQRYIVSTDASLWSAQRPGNSLWPRTSGGSLNVVVNYSAKWRGLSAEARAAFRRDALWLGWTNSDIDTAYPNLTSQVDRRYASNSYGLERTTFTR